MASLVWIIRTAELDGSIVSEWFNSVKLLKINSIFHKFIFSAALSQAGPKSRPATVRICNSRQWHEIGNGGMGEAARRLIFGLD
ncbi:hypothetical protein [Chromobacterium violaceum]|uniref:hypothetical protein n=1 Tax=Chromobacterium violaceum TaxID=536 RepID=UPI001B338FA0|nr:hypothetical protein [Chromobacterium violaceum]MBP4046796.1 hypothetical protein [Chromobacterium violaceum]